MGTPFFHSCMFLLLSFFLLSAALDSCIDLGIQDSAPMVSSISFTASDNVQFLPYKVFSLCSNNEPFVLAGAKTLVPANEYLTYVYTSDGAPETIPDRLPLLLWTESCGSYVVLFIDTSSEGSPKYISHRIRVTPEGPDLSDLDIGGQDVLPFLDSSKLDGGFPLFQSPVIYQNSYYLSEMNPYILVINQQQAGVYTRRLNFTNLDTVKDGAIQASFRIGFNGQSITLVGGRILVEGREEDVNQAFTCGFETIIDFKQCQVSPFEYQLRDDEHMTSSGGYFYASSISNGLLSTKARDQQYTGWSLDCLQFEGEPDAIAYHTASPGSDNFLLISAKKMTLVTNQWHDLCRPGQYVNQDDGKCVPCVGTSSYAKDHSLQKECSVCGEGTQSTPKHSACECVAGRRVVGTVCDLCPEMTYNEFAGNDSVCYNCPANGHSIPDRTACSCPPGTRFVPKNESRSAVCELCPENEISAQDNPTKKCTPCKSGFITHDHITCVKQAGGQGSIFKISIFLIVTFSFMFLVATPLFVYFTCISKRHTYTSIVNP